MKLLKILMNSFLLLMMHASYSAEQVDRALPGPMKDSYLEDNVDFNDLVSMDDTLTGDEYPSRAPISFGDIVNSLFTTGPDFDGLNDEEIREVKLLAEDLKAFPRVANSDFSSDSSPMDTASLESPRVLEQRPSVTIDQINQAVSLAVNSQPIQYDVVKQYGTTQCIYCLKEGIIKGFGEYGKEAKVVDTIRKAVAKHYNSEHRNDIILYGGKP